MKRFLFCGALCVASAALWSAHARPALAQNPTGNQNRNQQGGAVFQLPPDVSNVVSIDAQNLLIYQSERDGQTVYTPSIVQHVYSGGIARLFGGTVVPTAQFATPGLFNNNGNGQTGVTGAGNNNFGGGNNLGGGNGFGGNNFGGGNNLGGGNGFGGNNSGGGLTGGGNFGGGFGGFANGVFNGPLATNGGVVNLQIRPR